MLEELELEARVASEGVDAEKTFFEEKKDWEAVWDAERRGGGGNVRLSLLELVSVNVPVDPPIADPVDVVIEAAVVLEAPIELVAVTVPDAVDCERGMVNVLVVDWIAFDPWIMIWFREALPNCPVRERDFMDLLLMGSGVSWMVFLLLQIILSMSNIRDSMVWRLVIPKLILLSLFGSFGMEFWIPDGKDDADSDDDDGTVEFSLLFKETREGGGEKESREGGLSGR